MFKYIRDDNDYFEKYLEYFPDEPSLVLVRSVELKNFPKEFIRQPVLDLCCGDGFFSKCLGLSEIYGCDIDESAIKKAEDTNVYRQAKVCDVRDLSVYPDAYFQTIISNCALEHVDGIDRTLTNITRVLKTGGHLIMSVPSNNLNDWYLPKIIFEKFGLHKFGKHILEKYNKRQVIINLYSLNMWLEKLNGAGFKIVKHFFLFNERYYKVATFLDSFGGYFLGKFHLIFRMITPVTFYKFLWRKMLKPIYLKSEPIDFGGELVIVAEKK